MNPMRCFRCDEKAAIRMRQHRLSLCKDHYIEWFVEQTDRAIRHQHMFTRRDRVLVAVSGGKDSLGLWDVLGKLGYQADGLYINLGIAGEEPYSAQSEEYARAFAAERSLVLHVVNVKDTYGRDIPNLARRSRRGKEKPCSVCGLTKRHVMNRISHEMNYDVLATAHNLDDEVAVLMGNVMNWHTDLLGRQSPVLDAADGFSRKVKPFFRFYERETAAYALLRGIEYIEDECPFSVGSKQLYYKDMLNRIEEEQPGTKLAFYIGFLNAREKGAFKELPDAARDGELRDCPNCGQPTSNEGLCSFCRVVSNP